MPWHSKMHGRERRMFWNPKRFPGHTKGVGGLCPHRSASTAQKGGGEIGEVHWAFISSRVECFRVTRQILRPLGGKDVSCNAMGASHTYFRKQARRQ